MNVFLSYASEDRAVAEPINLALLAQGHDVFFDRDDLPPGAEYDNRVRRAVERADLFVFLVSGKSLQPQRYTLSELGIAQRKWRHPDGRVLPVLIEPIGAAELPAYLRSVTLLEGQGNLTANVADAVHNLARTHARRVWLRRLAAVVALALVAAVAYALRNQGGPASEVRGRDGGEAVLIRGGSFILGDDEHAPLREVYVDDFYLDRHEVTTAQYAGFVQALGLSQRPEHWDDALADAQLPVVGVTWQEADTYCRWAGKRLPTDAEWEAAARGGDSRPYPWGDQPPDARHARFAVSADAPYQGGLAAVGSHAAGDSAAGVHDLAGNVSEWVADWYAEGIDSGQTHNPKGPETGTAKAIRGGGWYDAAERILSTRRYFADPQQRSDDIGFRCAQDPR